MREADAERDVDRAVANHELEIATPEPHLGDDRKPETTERGHIVGVCENAQGFFVADALERSRRTSGQTA